jgi:hypothetical protein
MSTTTHATMPTIHVNGTDPAMILKQHVHAMSLVRGAISAVQDAAPNGRDYYPQGDSAIDTALAAHRARLAKLESVLTELREIAEFVASVA